MTFKSHLKKLSPVTIAFLLLFSCSKEDFTGNEPETDRPPLFVAGYLPYYGFDRFDTDMLPHLDRLYYFSVYPDNEGNYQMPDLQRENIEFLRSGLTGTETELFIVLGGWYESENIFPMAASLIKRENYVQSLIEFCLENDIDGIDLDWESYPEKVPQNDYLALIDLLSSGLKKHNLKFTVAIAPSQYDLSALFFQKVDQLNIMSYGILDNNGNQVTMTQLTDWLIKFDYAQIPRSKMIVGVPFYGKRPIEEGNNTLRSVIYSYIVDQISPGPFMNKYENYGFNGRKLMETKTEYLRKYSYYGIMAWELTQDAPYNSDFSLMRTIVNEAR